MSDKANQLLAEMDFPPCDTPFEECMRELHASRNEWGLYPRKCDFTGENILSGFPADSSYTVYKNEIWWGDSWEALDYGQDYDFNRPFFEQYYELQLKVPREGTTIFDSENCEYNSHVRYSKNCYLNTLMVRGEDVHYSYWMVDTEDTMDSCYHISGKSTACYECIDFADCYQCFVMQEAYNCNDCLFGYQLRGCDHCIFCSNLNNASYHIRNQPCSKEEFAALKEELLNGSYKTFNKAYEDFIKVRKEAIHRAATNINCEDSSGNHLFNCRNCVNCYDGDESEDCSNLISLSDSKDIHTCVSAGWPRCEKLYRCITSRGCTDMAFCRYMWFSSGMRYCDSCQTCNNCFGCTGLRHKDYCILNKQYSKEEYETLLPKVVEHMKSTGEWGKFWPYENLPYSYNESGAHVLFPLTREQALAKGYAWRDAPEEEPDVKKIIQASQLPDALADTPDDIVNWAVRCEKTNKPFRIIRQELDFYRKFNLPIPRVHPLERNYRRLHMRPPFKLEEKSCTKCKKNISTSLNETGSIYCEECYLAEVY